MPGPDPRDPFAPDAPSLTAAQSDPFAPTSSTPRSSADPFAPEGFTPAAPPAPPPEDVGFFQNAWRQFKGGMTDFTASRKGYRGIRQTEEAGRLEREGDEFHPAEMGTVDARYREIATQLQQERRYLEDLRQFSPNATAEIEATAGRVDVLERGLAGIRGPEIERLRERAAENLAKSAEARAKGEELPVNPITEEFLDEDSERGAWEIFWDDPLTIITDIGVRSLPQMTEGLAAGGVMAAAGTGPVGFGLGLGMGSAKAEMANSVIEELRNAGVDITDPDALAAAVSDQEFMSRVMDVATARAIMIGGFDALSGIFGGKMLSPAFESLIKKHGVNAAAQMILQSGLGMGGEASAQLAAGQEFQGRQILAEGIGELVGAPLEVTGAALSARSEAAARAAETAGAGATPRVSPLDDLDRAEADLQQARADAQALDEAKEAARERVRREGGDELDQELAAAEVGRDAGDALSQERARILEARREVERDRAYEAAQIEEDEARAKIQAEAAARYEQQQARQRSEAAHQQAEAEAAARKETEVKEAEYQRELQKGAEIEAEAAATPTLADVAPAEVRELARKKAEPQGAAKPKPTPPPPAKAAPTPALTDQRADFVVSREGVTLDKKAQDALSRASQEIAQDINPDLPTPTRAQEDAENYKVGRIKGEEIGYPGVDMSLENSPGSQRGEGRTVGHYVGRILGTKGADWTGRHGHLDSIIAKNPRGERVFVIDQVDEQGQFDEHKVVFGARNAAEAAKVHKQVYTQPGDMKVGAITEMSLDDFKAWAYDGQVKSKPVGKLKQPQRAPRRTGKEPLQFKISDEDSARASVRKEAGDETVVELTAPDGRRLGSIDMVDRGDKLQVVLSRLYPDARGRGHGQRLIFEALKEAYRQGKALVSDHAVSVKQLRAYMGLRRLGFDIQFADEAGVQELLEQYEGDVDPYAGDAPAGYTTPDASPVVTKIDFGPNMAAELNFQLAEEDLGIGMDVASAKQVLDPVLNLLPQLKNHVRILSTPGEASPRVYQEMKRTGNLFAPGVYDPTTKQIYLFAGNIATEASLVSTLMHEGVAHFGVRVLLGENWKGVMQDVYNSVKDQPRFKELAKRYGYDLQSPGDQVRAADEYVASIAEQPIDTPVLQRLIAAVRRVLRELGLVAQWTDNDIRALLRDSRSGLTGIPLDQVYLTREVEIEESGEVVELEERADIVLLKHDKRRKLIERIRECVA